MIHLYCGNGKGKTTAAMGLALRAAGSGMKVLVVQFLKDDSSSEIKSLLLLPGVNLLHRSGKEKFAFCMTGDEKRERKTVYEDLLAEAEKTCLDKKINLLVLDEIVRAVNCGFIDEKILMGFLKKCHEKLEIVLTGAQPSQELLKIADYVSEIVKRKHPYDKGTKARRGIEY